MAKPGIEKILDRQASFRAEVEKHLEYGLPLALNFVIRVIEGKEEETTLYKGQKVSRPCSISTRLDACRRFKELAVDKVLPDMKENKVETEIFSTKDILEEIARKKRQELEEAAAKQGKLKRVAK